MTANNLALGDAVKVKKVISNYHKGRYIGTHIRWVPATVTGVTPLTVAYSDGEREAFPNTLNIERA